MTERLLDKFLESDSQKQAELLAMLTPDERHALLVILDAELENPWARWQNDPIGFVEQGLNETLWSKQKEILTSVMNNKRTVVPACHAPGKSHLSGESSCLVAVMSCGGYSGSNYHRHYTPTS
jgi:hypothetical protein